MTLYIKLFGSLSVQRFFPDGKSSELILTSRIANFFAFLALFRGRYFSREELVSELWDDDYGVGVSQGAFNTILWRLRKKIESNNEKSGTIISRDRRGFVCFRKESDVYLDFEEFKNSAQVGLDCPIEKLGQTHIEALKKAVTLHQNDILKNFSAAWALREREKIRRVYFKALAKLVTYYRARHDYDASVHYAQLILDSEPLREDVHREIMELYKLMGQQALALRQFEICRELLMKELAIPPMPQTTKLYRSIADAALHPVLSEKLQTLAGPLENFDIPREVLPHDNKTPIKIDNLAQLSSADSSPAKLLIQQARVLIADADNCLAECEKQSEANFDSV